MIGANVYQLQYLSMVSASFCGLEYAALPYARIVCLISFTIIWCRIASQDMLQNGSYGIRMVNVKNKLINWPRVFK